METERFISDNFTAKENRCRCGECFRYSADVELVFVMERLRAYYGVRIFVNSWFRCRAHNNRPKNQRNSHGVYGAGSNDNSWHLLGSAVDFRVEGVRPADVYRLLRSWYPEKYGLGLYPDFVHLDVRSFRADWFEPTELLSGELLA